MQRNTLSRTKMRSKSRSTEYVRVMYRFWSGIYDGVLDVIFRFDRGLAIRTLDPKAGENVLEAGCGTGLNLPFFPKGCKVSAVDISKEMLAKAKEKTVKANISFYAADARDLPFLNGMFDKALATFVLRVTPNPEKVMEELARVVRPGGTVVIVDHFKRSLMDGFLNPLTFALGWGRSIRASDIVSNTAWKVASRMEIGSRVEMIELRRKS